MSYDIELVNPVTKDVLVLDNPHQMRGGTYMRGGNIKCHLNITYNYSKHYYRVFGEDGIRLLYGKTGAQSIPILKEGISKLGDDVAEDYWASTEGNAKRALCQLLALAEMRPDGVWSGD